MLLDVVEVRIRTFPNDKRGVSIRQRDAFGKLRAVVGGWKSATDLAREIYVKNTELDVFQ